MPIALKTIPKGWEKINLGVACNFERGIEPGADAYNTEGVGERFLRVVDVTESRNDPIYVDIRTTKKLKENDIALTLDGTIGAVKTGLNGIYSTGIRKVSFKNGVNYSRLLYYILQSNTIQKIIDVYASGSTIKHASSAIPHLFTVIPNSSSERNKITEVLSTIDGAIEKTDALIEKYKRMKTGMMQDLFCYGIDDKGKIRSEKTHKFKNSPLGKIPEEWKVVNILSFINQADPNAIKPGPFGSDLKKETYTENGFKVYGQEQVIAGNPDIGNYWISKKKYNELVAFKIAAGDVLISLVGTIGNVLVLPQNCSAGIINPRLLKITPDVNKCDMRFLVYSLLHEKTNAQLNNFATGGTMPVLNKGIIENIAFVFPPQKEQKLISGAIDRIENLTVRETLGREKLASLKAGLMEDLLTGIVRVNNLAK